MTDYELFDIVAEHREAWPDMYEPKGCGGDIRIIKCGSLMVDDDDTVSEETMLAFEASFNRTLMERTSSVRCERWPDSFQVTVQHHDFDEPTLIEAYAKALEWTK